MPLPLEIIVPSVVAVLILIMLYVNSRSRVSLLEYQLTRMMSRKQSLSTKYGQMTEQFFPFMKDYPYDVSKFRFLGSPVDGVQFEDDRIMFIEFKAADSKMKKNQKKIRDLVKDRKVGFQEFRIR